MVAVHTVLTLRGVEDGEDGGCTGDSRQQHEGGVERATAHTVQQHDAEDVGHQLHHSRQQEVDVHAAAQVPDVQVQAVERQTAHEPEQAASGGQEVEEVL